MCVYVCVYVCMYACMHACMYVCTWTIASYILDISADPGPSHGRGGAWDHLWCGPWLFPIYAPIASIAIAFRLPSVQTLRGTTSIVPFRNCRTHPALGPPNAPNPPRHHLYRSETAGHTPPGPPNAPNAPRQHLFCTAPKLPDTPRPRPTEPSKRFPAARLPLIGCSLPSLQRLPAAFLLPHHCSCQTQPRYQGVGGTRALAHSIYT